MSEKFIYLDNNATTPVDKKVFDAMAPFFTEKFGNPSSPYNLAKEALHAIREAREHLASLIGAKATEIIFTSCGTESNNASLRSALRTTRKRHIVTTQVEHSAIHNLVEDLESWGYSITSLSVDSEGQLNLEELEQSIHHDTAIVSVMWANNETGVLFPIEKVAAICQQKKVLLHVDAVQAVGKIPIDLTSLPIHFLSISGHKLHAPKGIGALYIRTGTPFSPFQIGGSQEKGRRGGTENVPYIVGLGCAAQVAKENLSLQNTHVKPLRDTLEKALLAIPHSTVYGGSSERLPNTLNIRFQGVSGKVLLEKLNAHNIYVSTGSACTTEVETPSHVLTAMGSSATEAKESLRFSLSKENTREEIDAAIAIITQEINLLRK